jgi:hypothetical protein
LLPQQQQGERRALHSPDAPPPGFAALVDPISHPVAKIPPDTLANETVGPALLIARWLSAKPARIRRLSRPSSKRSTISTACSTFALSRGFLGLAGRMAVKQWAAISA